MSLSTLKIRLSLCNNWQNIIFVLSAFFCFIAIFLGLNRFDVLFFILPLIILIVCMLFRLPELSFILFLNAGIYKADPRFSLPYFFDFTVFFCFITIISMIFRIKKRNIILLPFRKLILPYFGLMCLFVISFAYTQAPIYGKYKLLRFLTITTSAAFIPLLLFQNESSINKFFIFHVGFSTVAIFDSTINIIRHGITGFVGTLGSDYLGLGRISGEAIIILSFYFFIKSKRKVLKMLVFCLIFIDAFALLISGARSPVFAVIIIFILFLIYFILRFLLSNLARIGRYMDKKYKHLALTLLSLILIFSFLFINYNDFFVKLVNRTRVLLTTVGDSALSRKYKYEKALNVITDFPSCLTGLGIGGFSVFAHGYDEKRGAYPHNIFLEIGSEIGIFGLFIFSLMIYWVFSLSFEILRRVKENQYYMNITVFFLFLFTLLQASTHGDINDNRILFTLISLIHALKHLTDMRPLYNSYDKGFHLLTRRK